MKRFIARIAWKVVPRTAANLQFLSEAGVSGNDVIDEVRRYGEELEELKSEMNEIRRNERRMAELYDLVFERIRNDNGVDGD